MNNTNIRAGQICLVADNSVQSLIFWKQLHASYPYLLCPCSIKSSTKLRVLDELAGSAVVVQLVDDPKKLSVFKKKDLKVCHS